LAIRTGLAAQLGIKAETVYGTAVVPDRFFYVETARINPLIRKRRVNARGAGIVQRTNLSQTVLTGATGQFVLPVMDSSFGIFNKLLLGANTTTQVGGTAEYTHSGVIDTTAAGYGASYTAQLGVPGADGTVRAFTAEGGKCTGWELSCAEGEHMQLSIDMDFETVVTATALASPSFPSGWTPYVSEDCTWTIGGSAVFVRDWTITGTPTVDVDRAAPRAVVDRAVHGRRRAGYGVQRPDALQRVRGRHAAGGGDDRDRRHDPDGIEPVQVNDHLRQV
jgi:hypothetical protein